VEPAGAERPAGKKPWRAPRVVLEGKLSELTRSNDLPDDPSSVFGPFGASPNGSSLNCL
jgi:hypothetical protein